MTTVKARKPKPIVIPERYVQKACLAIMTTADWCVYRRNVGAFKLGDRYIRAAEKGQSDIYGFIPFLCGRHIECEIKRKGERPTLDQVEWLMQCHRAGCLAFWADSAERCREVVERVDDGGWIEYPVGKRIYPLMVKGKKVGTVEGPSGDYELV